jgi:Ser/Thr protein kinase RdoA (MazF antagonist)
MRETVEVSEAMRAAARVAARLGVTGVTPRLLRHSNHVSLRFEPLPVVARVRRLGRGGEAILARELTVVEHLAERNAPVAPPWSDAPAGPHVEGAFGLTLWQFIDHRPVDDESQTDISRAGLALRQVHRALADYRGELPSYREKFDECRSLLDDHSALPALRDEDRRFLRAVYDHVVDKLDAAKLDVVPIHGDAHLGNVLMTRDGPLWTDFESACLGPREWDLRWTPDDEMPTSVDRNILLTLGYSKSLCVSVWCWDKYELAEKREAAEYHLAYLRQQFSQ